MVLSIVIPAFNEEKCIANTLKKIEGVLQHQAIKKKDWEIIVCDNNSTDNTALLATEHGAKVVVESINQISRARNTGASIAKGKWLLFIDADTYPDIGLMNDIINIIENDKLVGCGTTVEVVDGHWLNKLRMERLNPLFRLCNISGGAFLLCQKGAFDSINGFSTYLYAYEEIDFVLRLKKYGKSIGKEFKVLFKNPVFTSGRKGDINFMSIVRLVFSNFVAVILFLLYFILPKKVIKFAGKSLLKYWYADKKTIHNLH